MDFSQINLRRGTQPLLVRCKRLLLGHYAGRTALPLREGT